MTSALGALKNAFRPNIERKGNFIRDAWNRLEKLPGGKRIFSRLVGRAAPYTGTIGAHIEELRQDYARVTLRDRKEVRNHLRCVHAVALANLAELTGNIAVAYSLPDDARFIVAGMSIEYLKKARGTLTATSTPRIPQVSERKEYDVHVEIRDTSGDLCAKATLRTLVGPKKADA
jgi:uncharacterized protein (TIGR00369 family)